MMRFARKFFVLLPFIALAACASQQPTCPQCAPLAVGRYQLVATENGTFIIDTTNGHTWYRGPETWNDLGSPTTESSK
jgi:uncharacterized lipoprotein YbaY